MLFDRHMRNKHVAIPIFVADIFLKFEVSWSWHPTFRNDANVPEGTTFL